MSAAVQIKTGMMSQYHAYVLSMQDRVHDDVDDESGDTPAAVETQVQRELADLQRQVSQAASRISEAKQKRRTLLADISSCTRERLVSDPPHETMNLSMLAELCTIDQGRARALQSSLGSD